MPDVIVCSRHRCPTRTLDLPTLTRVTGRHGRVQISGRRRERGERFRVKHYLGGTSDTKPVNFERMLGTIDDVLGAG